MKLKRIVTPKGLAPFFRSLGWSEPVEVAIDDGNLTVELGDVWVGPPNEELWARSGVVAHVPPTLEGAAAWAARHGAAFPESWGTPTTRPVTNGDHPAPWIFTARLKGRGDMRFVVYLPEE